MSDMVNSFFLYNKKNIFFVISLENKIEVLLHTRCFVFSLPHVLSLDLPHVLMLSLDLPHILSLDLWLLTLDFWLLGLIPNNDNL
jgi:hypothetical protein